MPTYSTPPTNFSELVQPVPRNIQSVANQLRHIIQGTLPDADEQVSGGKKFGNALYSIGQPTNVICGIQPTENFCRLFFHGWQELQKQGYNLSGTGKNARHIKIYSLIQIDPESIRKMIQIAKMNVIATK